MCKDRIFDEIVDLNRERIHARLQSKHFPLPKMSKKANHRPPQQEPLGPELQRLAQNSIWQAGSAILQRSLTVLCATYSRADACTRATDDEKEVLKSVARQSHDFCTPGGRTIKEAVAFYGFRSQDIMENKHIRQVNKLGRYWGLCEDLVEASRKYRNLFSEVRLQPVPLYQSSNAQVASKDSKIPCFVHAEIQLLTYYGLHSDPETLQPRVLGVSKSACYLCNLFINSHQQFFITKTHGRLYPLWNVPDLATYSPVQRADIRRTLKTMDQEIRRAIKKKYGRRAWPTESYVHLPPHFLTSPAPSSTVASDVPNGADPGTEMPRALHDSHLVTGSNVQNVPPTPTSPPPAYAVTVPSTSPRQALPPGLPDLNTPTTNPASRTLSSSSIESWEYPIHRTITAAKSFRKKSGKVAMTCEIEGPALGSVAIARLTDEEPTTGRPVNIGAMKENKTLLFEKKSGEDCVVLDLQGPDGKTTQLTLRWL